MYWCRRQPLATSSMMVYPFSIWLLCWFLYLRYATDPGYFFVVHSVLQEVGGNGVRCGGAGHSRPLCCPQSMHYLYLYYLNRGTAVAQWLRHCTTNRKVAGSIPPGVSGFFIDIKSFRSHYGPGVDSASNRNEFQEHLLGLKAAGA